MKKTLLSIILGLFLVTAYAAKEDVKSGKENTEQTTLKPEEEKDLQKKIVDLEKTAKDTVTKADLTWDTHEIIKEKFVQGSPLFMGMILVTLILGLGIAIERTIALNIANVNSDKLLEQTREAYQRGGAEEALKVTKNTPGPIASLFTQGLLRINEGIENVEKSIVSYANVEVGKLNKGISWIGLFIALAPLFGFMGTVIGMIIVFEEIEKAGSIEIAVVAKGMKVKLLTTITGLIVAVVLQILYNYCVSKIDSLINKMEEASISFVDMLIAEDLKKK